MISELGKYLATIFDSEVRVANTVCSTLLKSHGRVIVEGGAGEGPDVRSFGVTALESVGTNIVLDPESLRRCQGRRGCCRGSRNLRRGGTCDQ